MYKYSALRPVFNFSIKILCRAKLGLQTYSIFALMMRAVYHSNPKKSMKPKDLFDRSKMVTDEQKKKSIENRAKQAEADMQFLQNLNFG